jgi:hypothetical protein
MRSISLLKTHVPSYCDLYSHLRPYVIDYVTSLSVYTCATESADNTVDALKQPLSTCGSVVQGDYTSCTHRALYFQFLDATHRADRRWRVICSEAEIHLYAGRCLASTLQLIASNSSSSRRGRTLTVGARGAIRMPADGTPELRHNIVRAVSAAAAAAT